MRRYFILSALLAPSLSFAAGSDVNLPPTPTETTTICEEGYIYDEESKTCVVPQDSSLTDDDRYSAVRELAYAGRLLDAQRVLETMDQNNDRTLTYWGFTHRKMGNDTQAIAYYTKAIAQNPDNLLARSYMGQGYAAAGAKDLAELQLAQIVARGGADTWPALALERAILRGQGYSY